MLSDVEELVDRLEEKADEVIGFDLLVGADRDIPLFIVVADADKQNRGSVIPDQVVGPHGESVGADLFYPLVIHRAAQGLSHLKSETSSGGDPVFYDRVDSTLVSRTLKIGEELGQEGLRGHVPVKREVLLIRLRHVDPECFDPFALWLVGRVDLYLSDRPSHNPGGEYSLVLQLQDLKGTFQSIHVSPPYPLSWETLDRYGFPERVQILRAAPSRTEIFEGVTPLEKILGDNSDKTIPNFEQRSLQFLIIQAFLIRAFFPKDGESSNTPQSIQAEK